jgi:hypothetical protein
MDNACQTDDYIIRKRKQVQRMTPEATGHRERISRILLILGAIPSGCLGIGLTLGGCCLGAGWLVALARGASAAELPDPTAIVYPILMLPAGLILILVSALLLAARQRLRR